LPPIKANIWPTKWPHLAELPALAGPVAIFHEAPPFPGGCSPEEGSEARSMSATRMAATVRRPSFSGSALLRFEIDHGVLDPAPRVVCCISGDRSTPRISTGVAKPRCDSALVTPAAELAFLTLRSTTSSSVVTSVEPAFDRWLHSAQRSTGDRFREIWIWVANVSSWPVSDAEIYPRLESNGS